LGAFVVLYDDAKNSFPSKNQTRTRKVRIKSLTFFCVQRRDEQEKIEKSELSCIVNRSRVVNIYCMKNKKRKFKYLCAVKTSQQFFSWLSADLL
jgi:hypothetical protein